jgi:hypothetical protein
MTEKSFETISSPEITTDKQTYKIGETIIITVKNNGGIVLKFPDTSLRLYLKNLTTGKEFGSAGGDAITDLPPGKSMVLFSNKLIKEKPGPGKYVAGVNYYSFDTSPPLLSAETNFEISS